MKKTLRLLVPLIGGVTSANMYYIQPLIPYVSYSQSVTYQSAALLYCLALVGNALALTFIIPAADFIDRKKLLLSLYTLSGISLVLFRVLNGYISLCVLSTLTGVGASALPLMVADISRRTQDKRIIGHIMGGILVGILSSRFIACFFCALWGWRSVYLVAGLAMFLISGLLFVVYPRTAETEIDRQIRYPVMLRLSLTLLVSNATVRYYSVNGFFLMFLFAAFWSNVSAYLLMSFHLSTWQTGIFSLAGVAGAGAAFFSGVILNHCRNSMLFLRGGCLLSVGLMALDHSLWMLITGTLLVDAFIQLLHVSNQTRLYSACPGKESRVASIYMTSFVLGGAAGGYVSSRIFTLSGWSGVLMLCLGTSVCLLILYVVCHNRIDAA
ncbi:MFS transporter [Citrobacter sp. S2-9]|uniref:MFS transporter n=1 Tax=Citrobacter enshiensis TaxID=2971264 RepID=A0ABT8PRG0_9ENTR|nr:MFS transporter [Citrobacter enshiensis]MDN8598854.1 MFS transporter [Citrobacter enshiensis]